MLFVYFVHRTTYKDIQLYTVYKWDSEESLKNCELTQIQEVFHVYLNKFEIALTHLFLIISSNN